MIFMESLYAHLRELQLSAKMLPLTKASLVEQNAVPGLPV